MENRQQQAGPMPEKPCGCFCAPHPHLIFVRELGMDDQYGEASIWTCPDCGQLWLRYFYELEAFTASGRWWLGAVSAQQAAELSAENARTVLEGLEMRHYGGSYFMR